VKLQYLWDSLGVVLHSEPDRIRVKITAEKVLQQAASEPACGVIQGCETTHTLIAKVDFSRNGLLKVGAFGGRIGEQRHRIG